MSDRALRRRCLTSLLALLPVTAIAQSPTDSAIAAQAARVTQLEQAWRDAARVAEEAEQRARARRGLTDTVRVGAVRVLATRDAAPHARAAATQAWAALEATFGDAVHGLDAMSFHLAADTTRTRTPRWRMGAMEGERIAGNWLVAGDPTERLAGSIVATGESRLTDALDGALVGWLGTRIAVGMPTREEREQVYVSLATHPTRPARACLAGGIDACATALDLRPTADPIAQFFDADGRRAVVRGLEPYRRANGLPHTALWVECVDAGRDDACLRYMRATFPAQLSLHLDQASRALLVRQALAAGGRGAYARLRASTGRPLLERLALAAGVAPEALVRDWRTSVLAAAPPPSALPVATAWTTLAWILALLLLATRSTRWR